MTGLIYTFHAPLHRAACEALGRVAAARLGRRFGRDLTLSVADLGWSIQIAGRLPGSHSTFESIMPLFDLEGFTDDVLEGLDRGELPARRFRHVAATALMVLSNPEPGRRVRVGGMNWVSTPALPAGESRLPRPSLAPRDPPRGAQRNPGCPGRNPLDQPEAVGSAPRAPGSVTVRGRVDRARPGRGPPVRAAG